MKSLGNTGKSPLNKKMIKRIMIGAAVVAVAAAGIWYVTDDSVEVRCMELSQQTYVDTFTETGHVKRGETVNYISEVDGNVVSVNVAKGARVVKGDIVAVIDSADLEYEKQICSSEIAALEASKKEISQEALINRNEIQAAISEANLQLQEVENQKKLSSYTENMTVSPEIYINSLRVAKNQAQTNKKYFSQLVKSLNSEIDTLKSSVSGGDADAMDAEQKAQLAELEAKLKEAKKEYNNAKEEAESAEAAYKDAVNRMNDGALNEGYYSTIQSDFDLQLEKIKTNKAALEKKLNNDVSNASTLRVNNEIDAKLAQLAQLEKKIEACRIVAQSDGIVSDLPVENTSRIGAGETVATIRTEDAVAVETEVLTSDAPYLKEGDKVKLIHKLKSGQREYEGTILSVYDYADKTVSALGNDEYRVKVIIGMEDSEDLRDGYELSVVFTVCEQEQAISVPNSALFKRDDEYCVFAVRKGKAVITPVEVLHRGSSGTLIASGLAENDVVVIDANTKDLTDGSSVDTELVNK